VERTEEVVVADASVIVKWFVQEEYSDKALDLRDDYVNRMVDIASSELLPFEVLNSLRYNPEFGEKDIKESAVAIEKYGLWYFSLLGGLVEKSIENALRYGISIYDACYISLGELKMMTVYTADEKLLKKVKGTLWLRHISDYERKTSRLV